MSDAIIDRVDEMSSRVDELEKSVQELMVQVSTCVSTWFLLDILFRCSKFTEDTICCTNQKPCVSFRQLLSAAWYAYDAVSLVTYTSAYSELFRLIYLYLLP